MTPTEFKKRQSAKKNKNISSVSNALIESFVSKNNAVALKILFYISKGELDPKEQELIKFKIDSKKLCDYCNINMQTLRRNLKQMTNTSLTFVQENEYEEYIAVIPKIKVIYGGYIEFSMFHKILKLIQEVENKFTVIDLSNLMKLKSKHSIKMIQLLEMIQGFSKDIAKRKYYSLEELNGLFGTNYKTVYEFERRILKNVKIELDEVSNLSFTYSKKMDKEDIGTAGRPKAVGLYIELLDNKKRQLKLF
jgi:plasmid replication initiation protein